MGFYADRVLPRIMERMMSGPELGRVRGRVTAGLSGEVLEVGFGSGLNMPHYPASVGRLLAVDPATVGRRLAAGRVAASPVPVEYVGLDGQTLPLPAASVDHALSTWTLCTIPDVAQALSEIRRVLRPGGTLHFVEHGRAPEAGVIRWQNRLTPVQRRIAGGCHLNRPIDQLITGSGLRMQRLENYYLPGLKALNYLYEGVAVNDPTPA